MHIPKTAGTSLRTIIAQNFLPWNVEQMYTHLEHAERAREIARRRGRSIAVLGHVGYGAHGELGLDDPQYVTMLRDPVERVISMYRHIRRAPEHQFHNLVSEMSLEEYVTSDLDESATNSQTRFLCGAKWENELAGRDDVCDFAGRAQEEALTDALRALEDMTVGISERFLESVAVLKHRFGFRWTYWARLNVADPLSQPLPESTRRIVREANELDEVVYRRALEVHRRQYLAVPDADNKVAGLQRQDDLISRMATRLAHRSLTWGR